MTLKDFIYGHNIEIKGFCKAIDISYTHIWSILNRARSPSLPIAIKIVEQTGGLVTMRDLLSEKIEFKWERKPRLVKRSRDLIRANVDKEIKRKKHYRLAYYKVLDEL